MSPAMPEAGLLRPGFAEPALDAQRCFRRLLRAMAHPGRIEEIAVAVEPPAPLTPASAALCLTLLDGDSPLWLDAAARSDEALSFLRFHCGCPLVEDSRQAAFALLAGPWPGLAGFSTGDDLTPEASATVIWQVDDLTAEGPLRLSGPGIESSQALGLAPLPAGFAEAWADNGALYPAGVDLILACGERLACLPRTTRLTPPEED